MTWWRSKGELFLARWAPSVCESNPLAHRVRRNRGGRAVVSSRTDVTLVTDATNADMSK